MDQPSLDRARAVFIEGMGAASATSGVLSQLQGRIFAVLFLEDDPLSLDEIAEALQQSKSNISINIRGLVEWHLVRRVSVPNSRKDHYEAASDFWRVMQEIMERRFRWNIRQVIAACDETSRTAAASRASSRGTERDRVFIQRRLEALRSFAAAVDAGIEAFARGEPITPRPMQVIHIEAGRKR
ncbi:MAG TPA: MarR family transcriptional regulator [Actinomycetota bacterium]|nr:MarR family transcriptional regulator [Actinomycetota bacterium]